MYVSSPLQKICTQLWVCIIKANQFFKGDLLERRLEAFWPVWSRCTAHEVAVIGLNCCQHNILNLSLVGTSEVICVLVSVFVAQGNSKSYKILGLST